MVSDIVLNGGLPESVLENMDAYSACISGAIEETGCLEIVRRAGFAAIEVTSEKGYTDALYTDTLYTDTGTDSIGIPDGVISSISVQASKPLA